ncbi:MAG: TlpA family protein disulfide reductase [Porticoccaceae bacterium]
MRIIVSSLFYLCFSFTPIESVADAFKLKVGDIPPDYLGLDSSAEKVLLSDNKGKIVVVTFWATWCPPCLKELPVLERLQRRLGPDLIRVIAVNHRESKKKFRLIKKAFNGSPITLTYDRGNRISKKYGVEAIPHLIIIGKDGKISYQARGYGESSIDMLVEKINQHLQT